MDVVVVGGGLAGLVAADAVAAAGLTVNVVEARPFVGGRTMTVVPEDLGENAWFDVGATWHWADQPRVAELARQLELGVFPQFRQGQAVSEEGDGKRPVRVDVPPPSPAEFRFAGGAQGLCERLAARLPPGSVSLNTTVVAVEAASPGELIVSVVDGDDRSVDLSTAYVVMAVPPRLALDNIAFTPDLPEDFQDVMRHTPTWMATALKCVAVYERPFWREAGLSGLAFSQGGPLREVHDACNDDASVAGLWGFISPRHEFRDLSFDDRLDQVFAQLARLFGTTAGDPLRYFERDWSGDPFTNDEVFWVPKDLLPYGHPAFAQPQWDRRLVWAGTETVSEGGGHMEGAIQSGQRAAAHILGAP